MRGMFEPTAGAPQPEAYLERKESPSIASIYGGIIGINGGEWAVYESTQSQAEASSLAMAEGSPCPQLGFPNDTIP